MALSIDSSAAFALIMNAWLCT